MSITKKATLHRLCKQSDKTDRQFFCIVRDCRLREEISLEQPSKPGKGTDPSMQL